MKILLRSALLILLLIILIPSSIVYAVPPQAQTFYGTVTLDGSPALDGTDVTATMNGRQFSDNTSGGSYSIIIQTIEGDQGGDAISFTVNGFNAGSTTLNPGGITTRNLSATTPPPPPDQHRLTIKVTGEGTTSPSPGSRNYDEDRVVTVRAIPADGWLFSDWDGDVSDRNSSQTTVRMDSDKTITANFVGETEAPIISGIDVADITRTSAIINWATNEPATSQVDYWASPGTLTPLDKVLVTEHSVLIEGLEPATTYTFKVMSADVADNLSISDEVTFETGFIDATFILSDWEFTTTETAPGKQVVIEFVIENTGDMEGTRDVPVTVNGSAETTESITLASGASQEVSITISKTTVGAYKMEVEGIILSFEVKDLVAPPADGGDNGGTTGDGLNSTLLIAIITGCLLVGVLIVFIALKIKSDKELTIAAGGLAEEKRLLRQTGETAGQEDTAGEKMAEVTEEESFEKAEVQEPYKEPGDAASVAETETRPKKTRAKKSGKAAAEDIITSIEGGTLTLTKLAAEKLKEALESQTKDPDVGIRLIPSPSPFGDSVQFEMTLDKERPGDIAITSQGTKILLISPEHTQALADKVINCQQTPQGIRFTIS